MKRELETCLGNVRGEYGPEDSGMERNDNEHPEQSYRRGVQHGAHFVLDPLLKAGLLDRALGNVRGEYGPEDSGMERNDNEHPEQSYRRGVQHGAHFVLDPLLKAGLLDRATQRKLEKFVYLRIYNWRYAKHRRPRRHLAHDRPPQLELKPEGRSATTS